MHCIFCGWFKVKDYYPANELEMDHQYIPRCMKVLDLQQHQVFLGRQWEPHRIRLVDQAIKPSGSRADRATPSFKAAHAPRPVLGCRASPVLLRAPMAATKTSEHPLTFLWMGGPLNMNELFVRGQPSCSEIHGFII